MDQKVQTISKPVFTKIFSQARLQPYYGSTVCFDEVLGLYTWNLKISAAFWTVLQTYEVVLRNAVGEALISVYNQNWYESFRFQRTLNDKMKHMLSSAVVDDVKIHGALSSDGVISSSKFAFWQGCFVKNPGQHLWQGNIRKYFPYAPEDVEDTELMIRFHNAANEIRKFRNRIAHCEPVFSQNLERILVLCLTMIGYREPLIVDWLKGVEQVSALIAENPHKTKRV